MDSKASSVSTWKLLRRFLSEAFTHKKLLVAVAVTIIGASIASLASPYILGIAIDKYIIPGRYGELPLIASLYLASLVAQWAFTSLRTWYIQAYGQRVLYNLRNELLDRLLRTRIGYFKDRQTGDLVSRIVNDTSIVNEVFISSMLGSIGDLISLVGIVVAMFILNVHLTLVVLLTVPLMVLIAKYFGGRMRRVYRETREKIARVSSIVEESVSGIETIKSFGREVDAEREFERASRETVKAFMRVAIYMGLFWPIMNLSTVLSIATVLVYGSYLVLQGVTSIGVVAAFVQYVQRFRGPINNVVTVYDSLQSALASLERIYEVVDGAEEESKDGLVKVESFKGEIELRRVWFEYEPGKPVIKSVSFRIRPGETVALVGHTGAGKTTLANLLMRFYDPTDGEILVDGIDVRRIDICSLREKIAYVPQETYLFPGTILDNIRVVKPDATEEEVIAVCKKLGIHDFIERLPRSYYTDAGEAGKKLSTGEKQLIAIARSMLKNPDIVILDEALSSLDIATEEVVRRAMKRLMKGRTAIIIAHRLTVALDADEVIVLEDGRVVEEGPPQELLVRRGKFYQLYTAQMGGLDMVSFAAK